MRSPAGIASIAETRTPSASPSAEYGARAPSPEATVGEDPVTPDHLSTEHLQQRRLAHAGLAADQHALAPAAARRVEGTRQLLQLIAAAGHPTLDVEN